MAFSHDPEGAEGDEASDEQLVRQLLALTSDYSGGEIASMVDGVTQHDVSRWRRNEFKRLSAAKRRAIKAFLEMRRLAGRGFWPQPGLREVGPDYPPDEEAAAALVIDPNLARRLVGQVKPEDRKTRLAILQEIESGFIEKGLAPPQWYEDLRREVLGLQ